jgi:hypothetical protein
MATAKEVLLSPYRKRRTMQPFPTLSELFLTTCICHTRPRADRADMAKLFASGKSTRSSQPGWPRGERRVVIVCWSTSVSSNRSEGIKRKTQ